MMKKRDMKNGAKRLASLGSTLRKKNREIAKLYSLIGITSIIQSSLDQTKVLKSILDQTKVLMECSESSVLIVDEAEEELYFAVVANEEQMSFLKDIRLKKGEGVAGHVWKTGKPLLLKDAQKDRRFSRKADHKLATVTKSLVAVPLFVDNKVIGVMEAINKKHDTAFSKFDMNIFLTLAVQAAIAINNARLYEMATTDGMTKLFLHRYFKSRMEYEFNRVKRYGRELSLIMFDIDHFKNFNDKYGHQFGDKVLIAVAQEIKKNCRAADIPARYGGEEFALILPETGREGALILAERIRKTIERTAVPFDNEKLNVTISAGVASYMVNLPKDTKEFIEAADQALYRSKENGRNRVS